MKSFLIILGIVILNTPAVLACDGKNARDDSNHFAFSSSYSALKYDLPPSRGSGTHSGGSR
jgi:hypothetical protein